MEEYKIQPHWNGLWKNYFSSIKLAIRYFNFWLCEEERRVSDTHFYTLRVRITRSVAADHYPNQHWGLNSCTQNMGTLNVQLSTLLKRHLKYLCVNCWLSFGEFETNKYTFLLKRKKIVLKLHPFNSYRHRLQCWHVEFTFCALL